MLRIRGERFCHYVRYVLVGALNIFVSLHSYLASGQVCAWRAPSLHDCEAIVHGFAFTIVERSPSALRSRLWTDHPRFCLHDCGAIALGFASTIAERCRAPKIVPIRNRPRGARNISLDAGTSRLDGSALMARIVVETRPTVSGA